MTQCEMILDHLKTFGSITPLEALHEYGCFRLAARIADLRDRGYRKNIVAVKNMHINRFNQKVYYAKYFWLPEGGENE